MGLGAASISLLLAPNQFLARPHLLTFPIIVVWTACLARASEEERTPSFWLLPLMVLWANLHGGFTLGLFLAAGFGLGRRSIGGTKRIRHISDASRSTSSRSTVVRAPQSTMTAVRMLDSVSMPSRATTTISARVSNCIRRDRRMLASVFEPVLLSALPRSASICRNEIIDLSSHRRFCSRSCRHQCLDQGRAFAGTLPLRLQTQARPLH